MAYRAYINMGLGGHLPPGDSEIPNRSTSKRVTACRCKAMEGGGGQLSSLDCYLHRSKNTVHYTPSPETTLLRGPGDLVSKS